MYMYRHTQSNWSIQSNTVFDRSLITEIDCGMGGKNVKLYFWKACLCQYSSLLA